MWDGSAGELRYNLIVDTLVGIIHKKPKEGGISAVGGTGSIYTYYGPEEVSFKTLTDNFLQKAGSGRLLVLGCGGGPLSLCSLRARLARPSLHPRAGPCPVTGPAEGDAVPGAGRRARAPVVDHGLHLGFPRGHAQGGGEVDRRRVQLLLRGHLQVPGRLLQGGHPNASFDDITDEDKAEAKKYGDLMGQKALGILSK